MNAKVVTFAVVASLIGAPAAFAAAADDVAVCAAALDAQGLAAADDYRAKFVKSKGGATKTVTIRLIPNGDGEAVTAECVIKRGEVTAASVAA